MCDKTFKIVSSIHAGLSEYKYIFQDPTMVQQCEGCFKYVRRFRDDRHDKCFYKSTTKSYRFISINKIYKCLLCFQDFGTKTSYVDHLLTEHHPLDLKFLGYNHHILKRVDKKAIAAARAEINTFDTSNEPLEGHDALTAKGKEGLATLLSNRLPFFKMLEPHTSSTISKRLEQGVYFKTYLRDDRFQHIYSV